ncbi:MAG: hypothetical protein EPN39_05265 [Chitinophagaceae bacterium]|nr:MAG: hypothetical protein EPN39_05265 [Chitinophagaceae bacterium]
MKNKNLKVWLIILGAVVILVVIGFIFFRNVNDVQIESIKLTSPNNSAFFENIQVNLNKPVSISVRYWSDSNSAVKYYTPETSNGFKHTIHLVLLKPATTYQYQVIVHDFFNLSSKIESFHTRSLGSWMIHDWVKKNHPHEAGAIGKGLVMLCYGGTPGYVAMIDSNGKIRWYWQVDSIGVRAATLTPRNTILVLLHNPGLDEINDVPDKSEVEKLNNMNVPLRRGRVGYAGGTSLAEVDLTGKILWRININADSLGYSSIHHDLRMDASHHILTLIRDPLPYNLSGEGGKVKDTLWGDALIRIDTTGKILWKWSPWTSWDFKDDRELNLLSYDRFHLNALWITKDSNYLISSAILNQIWKINAKTGKVMWKFGKSGNFKLDSGSYFYFQHDVNIAPNGDIIMFDNGDYSPFDTTQLKYRFTGLYTNSQYKVSRVLGFRLNERDMTSRCTLNIQLPPKDYSSRMGSAYFLPNNNLLVTSSKTGKVLVMDTTGKILWELDSYFVPYRAEYIPDSVWKDYFRIK